MSRCTIYQYISRLVAVLLACTLLMTGISSALADGESGTCGPALNWSFSAGTLSIEGTGDMSDFSLEQLPPWYDFRDEIYRVELPEGLTSVGALAFYQCDSLISVTIPDSVRKIGNYAFTECKALQILNMGNGVEQIGESAFSDCVALTALRLPTSLRSIGMKAFYRCESIGTVTVPESVKSIGMSAFSYCKMLVSANIQAGIQQIPQWLFYGCERLVSVSLPDDASDISRFAFRGCEQLTSVYYGGAEQTPEQIRELITADVPNFGGTGFVSDSLPSQTVTSGSTQVNADGTWTQENVTVVEKPETTVSTSMETTRTEDGSDISTSIRIDVTVSGENGWKDAAQAVEDALKTANDNAASGGGKTAKVDVNVYICGTDTLDEDFVEAITERNLTVNVTTEDGSAWSIEGTQGGMTGAYNMRYTLLAGSESLTQELEAANSYVLRFHAPAEVNAEVRIRLSKEYVLREVVLFQRWEDELVRHQTVVVDKDGYAHFYLASVTNETDYYIGIAAAKLEEQSQGAIVPDSIFAEYGISSPVNTLDYVITGTKSSWGMNIGQVTWILVGVMVASVAGIGFVMFRLNKRRLKAGYVPQLDDEEI